MREPREPSPESSAAARRRVAALTTLGALALADRIYGAGLGAEAWRELVRELAEGLGLDRLELVAERAEGATVIGGGGAGDGEPAAPGGEPERIELGGEERLAWRVAVAPKRRCETFGLLGELGRHVVRARALARALSQAADRDQLASATLDRLAAAVGVLDGEGRLVRANLALRRLLDGGRELGAAGESLTFASDLVARRFRALLAETRAETCAAPGGSRHLGSGALRVPRGDDRAPLELLVVALRGHELESASAGWALFVADPERAAEAPAALLRRLYGLTAGESRVVAELLAGRSVDEIGAHLAVRRETIRTHLRRIFAKVGTTRQVDLVRLLLTGAGGVRWE